MPEGKWFLTSIAYTVTATGIQIVIQTDTPCHLWMRESTTVPKEHLIQREKRGVLWMMDKYYCVDVYEDNEQEEAGDTLEHTFIKEPWPVCETRYFYFQGEIGGEPSPSTTAIFSKHRVAPAYGPPTWITCYLIDVAIGGRFRDLLWPVVRTKLPYVWARAFNWQIGTFLCYGQYYIRRKGGTWDTTTIPAGSLILDGFLRFYGHYTGDCAPQQDFTMHWVDGNAWDGGLDPNDGKLWADFNSIIASYDALTRQTSWGWRDAPLNEAGLAFINAGGLTRTVLRTDVDLNDIDPGATLRDWYWGDYGSASPPEMHIQYSPPL